VHINRAPIGGRITKIEYTRGKKVPATREEASLINERNSLTIENDSVKVRCTQIAGIVARRIVCWKKSGDSVERGERFGLIKFSSRTDLQMPGNVEILVGVDQHVKGGESIIARIIS
jgi:phosphatidylserine decarboxylase